MKDVSKKEDVRNWVIIDPISELLLQQVEGNPGINEKQWCACACQSHALQRKHPFGHFRCQRLCYENRGPPNINSTLIYHLIFILIISAILSKSRFCSATTLLPLGTTNINSHKNSLAPLLFLSGQRVCRSANTSIHSLSWLISYPPRPQATDSLLYLPTGTNCHNCQCY